MFSSAAWWFLSVVVVGIAVNIASTYLIPLFDKRYKKYSDVRAKLNIVEQTLREKEISRMIAEPLYFSWYTNKLTHVLIREHAMLIVLFICIGLLSSFIDYSIPITFYNPQFASDAPPFFMSLVGLLMLSIGINYLIYSRISSRMEATLREYWKRKNIS